MKSMHIFAAIASVMIFGAASVKAEGAISGLDNKKSAPLFAQLAAQAQAQATPGLAREEGGAEAAIMPARAIPEFTGRQVAGMNNSIDRLAEYAGKTMKNPRLEANFACLRQAGTPEEKAALLYGNGAAAYKFPAACSKSADKNILDDVLSWVCENVIVPVCENVCFVVSGTPVCEEQCTDSVVENCGWQ